MPTALDTAVNYTGAAITEAQQKTWITALRAALAEMGDPIAKYGAIQNCALSLTVAANALTIALKTRALADPDANNPVAIPFRNATLTTGDYSVLDIIAAQSLVVPDTALLGTVNATPFRLWIVEFNDAGVGRLGVVNCLSGTSIMNLKDDDLRSSTAIGTGSDAAHVIYSGSAVASKAMRILGYAEWATGLATAGTWSAGPTKVQPFGPGVPLPGQPVQVQRSFTGAMTTGSTIIPDDDTIPLNTEGDEYLSKAITPTSAANALQIESNIYASVSATGGSVTALFQDSTANALAAAVHGTAESARPKPNLLRHDMLAGTTSETTFKIRIGSTNAATLTFNGQSGGRLFGGVMASHLSITEVMA